jgi:hypothetical protein
LIREGQPIDRRACVFDALRRFGLFEALRRFAAGGWGVFDALSRFAAGGWAASVGSMLPIGGGVGRGLRR